ncbi:MAG: FIG00827129: hypothetical protein, partial [uncultured Frankineae bacterium]
DRRPELLRARRRGAPAAAGLRPGVGRDPHRRVEPDLRDVLVGRGRRPRARQLVHRPQRHAVADVGDPVAGARRETRRGVHLGGGRRARALELPAGAPRRRDAAHRDLAVPAGGPGVLPAEVRRGRRRADRGPAPRRPRGHPEDARGRTGRRRGRGV